MTSIFKIYKICYLVKTDNQTLKDAYKRIEADTFTNGVTHYFLGSAVTFVPMVCIFMGTFLLYAFLSDFIIKDLPIIVPSEGQVAEVSERTSTLVFGGLASFSALITDLILRKKFQTKVYLFQFLPLWLGAFIFLTLVSVYAYDAFK